MITVEHCASELLQFVLLFLLHIHISLSATTFYFCSTRQFFCRSYSRIVVTGLLPAGCYSFSPTKSIRILIVLVNVSKNYKITSRRTFISCVPSRGMADWGQCTSPKGHRSEGSQSLGLGLGLGLAHAVIA